MMDVLLPRTLDEALAMKAERPEAVPIAGGTDLMVELNFDRRRPECLMDISRLPELTAWRREEGWLFLGAGVTYARIVQELTSFGPLVEASRAVGSPQIRNRATVGGNLGTASPAGDALPVLAAYDADVTVASAAGTRTVPWTGFLVGPKRNAMRPEELILGVRWRISTGPGSFSKVGPRNAMIIAVASLCLIIDEARREVRIALGSVGPTILRARDAEARLSQAMAESGTWNDPAAPVPAPAVEEFRAGVAAAAQPIDDVRGTAAYRRHVCGILARRALSWALEDRGSAPGSTRPPRP
jgi:CO/xanthine dehydrogenase FAD-binding subunit